MWPFWFLADHMDETRTLGRPTAAHRRLARTSGPRRAPSGQRSRPPSKLGDDAAALAARKRLEPLLAEIEDPFLHAVSLLAAVWSAPLVDDLDGALQQASLCLEELRGQDEPLWTALTLGSLGFLEVTRWPRRRGAPPRERGARPRRAIGQRLARRLVAGDPGQGGRQPRPARRGTGAARRSARPERWRPQHHDPDLLPGRLRPPRSHGGRREQGRAVARAAESLRRRHGLRAWPISAIPRPS